MASIVDKLKHKIEIENKTVQLHELNDLYLQISAYLDPAVNSGLIKIIRKAEYLSCTQAPKEKYTFKGYTLTIEFFDEVIQITPMERTYNIISVKNRDKESYLAYKEGHWRFQSRKLTVSVLDDLFGYILFNPSK